MTDLSFEKWQKQTLQIECDNWKARALKAENKLEALRSEFIHGLWADHNEKNAQTGVAVK